MEALGFALAASVVVVWGLGWGDGLMARVGRCARCGGDHDGIVWERLERPIEDSDGTVWTDWAPCPVNGQPILCRVQGEVAEDGG